MKKKERLSLYKQALQDFENRNWYTDIGFCHYFSRKHHIEVYFRSYFEETFPELYAQKPEVEASIVGHWWENGDRKSRVEALKKAIELCGG